MQRKALCIVDIILGCVCVLVMAYILYMVVSASTASAQSEMVSMLMDNAFMKAMMVLLFLSIYWPFLLPFPATVALSAILVFGKKSSKVDTRIGLVFLLVAGVPVAMFLFFVLVGIVGAPALAVQRAAVSM